MIIISANNIGIDDYVKIHTLEGFFLKKKTMGHFNDTLDQRQFVRVHRSFILNIQQITRLEAHEKDSYLAILRSGHRVPVSKSGYARLKDILGL